MMRPKASLVALFVLSVAAALVLGAFRAAASSAAEAPAAKAPAAVTWKHYVVQSPATSKIERFWVGHAAGLKADGTYPVVYFLGGLLDNENEWKNALNSHLGAYEMIAVCPSVGGATWYMNSPAQPWMNWGDFLTRELVAFVEANYPASRQKGQRGVAGISAGAHGALYHAIKGDLYGSVSVISGALDLRAYAGAVGLEYWIGPRSRETLPLYTERTPLVLLARQAGPLPFDLFLDAGDKDGALPQMEVLKKVLDARKVPYKWNLGQGTHSWTYWKTRVEDHLAWHASEFERNRREQRYTETPPQLPVVLVPATIPSVDLSDAARQRLRAPWAPASGERFVRVQGVPIEGAPLDRNDEARHEVRLTAPLSAARGYTPRFASYRLELVVSTPLERAGTVGLRARFTNGRNQTIASLATPLPIPAGEANRKVPIRARLVLEIKEPDSLRGGIVLGLQFSDVGGKPPGDAVLGRAAPGTIAIEYWPLAPQGGLELAISVEGKGDLPLAAVYEARLTEEP